MKKFLDLVIAGPDMSGTSTQINGLINFFKIKGLKVRDLRGTEIEVLFHTEIFKNFNENYSSLSELPENEKKEFLFEAHNLMVGTKGPDLAVASCVKNDSSTYLNPNSADVWVMEEPTKRGAGQVNRVIEQNRSKYDSEIDYISAAITHSVYRIDEFLRFRKSFRENNKIIIRSRSEESGCYQIYDKGFLPNGIKLKDYLALPGHKIALSNPPTNIFVVSGPESWTVGDYLKLKEQRSGQRILDDYELNPEYQVLVNKRYASNWLNYFYNEGNKIYQRGLPKIYRFSIYDSKEEIIKQMIEKLGKII